MDLWIHDPWIHPAKRENCLGLMIIYHEHVSALGAHSYVFLLVEETRLLVESEDPQGAQSGCFARKARSTKRDDPDTSTY